MQHHMKLNDAPFEAMGRGAKTIELRLYDEKRRRVQVGDTIVFSHISNQKRKITARVTALHRFDSFAQLYAALPMERCGYAPGEQAHPSDMDAYYPREAQQKWGVVGIEITLAPGDGELVRTSRYISMLLRHKPEAAGLTLDRHGWVDAEELITAVSRTHVLNRALLERIVAEDEKQRYSFSEDGRRIRANQGHSIPVDVELQEMAPPRWLYHGTGEKYLESIREKGLIPKSRLYVHLSRDIPTAINVGARHGTPVVFRVDAERMHREGFRFLCSVNGVWLTDCVPVDYLSETEN